VIDIKQCTETIESKPNGTERTGSTMVARSEMTGIATSAADSKKKKSVWSDVPRRLITIFVGIPFVWKLLERPVTAYIFFFGAHALSAWEYSFLEPAIAIAGVSQTQQHKRPSTQTRLFFCATSIALATIPDTAASFFSFAVSLAAGGFAVANRHHWIVGLLVVTLPFRAWCNLACQFDGINNNYDRSSSSQYPSSFASTIAVLLTVWNADTGALIAGRLLGRRRKKTAAESARKGEDSGSNQLPSWIRRISPAKTMEGFLGGILGGVATAVWAIPLLLNALSIDTSPGFRKLWGLDVSNDGSEEGSTIINYASTSSANRFLLGFCLSVLAILGDLVESSIKRRSHSKDSGSILPGHGGILDRFDSSLLAVLFYRYVLERATAMGSDGGDIYAIQSNLEQGNIEL